MEDVLPSFSALLERLAGHAQEQLDVEVVLHLGVVVQHEPINEDIGQALSFLCGMLLDFGKLPAQANRRVLVNADLHRIVQMLV